MKSSIPAAHNGHKAVDIQEMANPDIAMTGRNREAIASLLNSILADEVVLSAKTRSHHWNVVGPQFSDLHKFFDSQYILLSETADQVAERVRALGERPLGTLDEFLKNTSLKEAPGAVLKAAGMLSDLLADHETVIRNLRADIATCQKHDGMGMADFVTGLMEQHMKMAWMLRSFLA